MSRTRVLRVVVDALYIALTVLGFGLFLTLFSVVVGNKLDRWADVHDIERPKRYRRVSPARSAIGMTLLIMGSSAGTGLVLIGGAAFVAAGVALVVGVLVGCLVILKRGESRPLPPLPPGLPARYDGFAYFWHCSLPRLMLSLGPGQARPVPRRGPCLRAE